MKTLSLLAQLSFGEKRSQAEPLLVDDTGRVLRFTLKPGQYLREHCAPHSPVHIVVLEGKGLFAAEGGQEVSLGPNSLVVFGAGELHRVRALDENLVFVALLHKVEETPTRRPALLEKDVYLTWHM